MPPLAPRPARLAHRPIPSHFRQLYVIDMISGALTVVVILGISAVNAVKSHWQASASAALALFAVVMIVFCAMGHKERQEAEPAADDDDGLGEDAKPAGGAASAEGGGAQVAANAAPPLVVSF